MCWAQWPALESIFIQLRLESKINCSHYTPAQSPDLLQPSPWDSPAPWERRGRFDQSPGLRWGEGNLGGGENWSSRWGWVAQKLRAPGFGPPWAFSKAASTKSPPFPGLSGQQWAPSSRAGQRWGHTRAGGWGRLFGSVGRRGPLPALGRRDWVGLVALWSLRHVPQYDRDWQLSWAAFESDNC